MRSALLIALIVACGAMAQVSQWINPHFGDLTAETTTTDTLTVDSLATVATMGITDLTVDSLNVTHDIEIGSDVIAGGYNFATAAMVSGDADSMVIDFDPDIPALTSGLMISFIKEGANTGACSLMVDSGAWKQVYEASDISALDANDMRDGSFIVIFYDGTQWQQVSQSGN